MLSVLFLSLLKPYSGTGWKTAQLVQSSLTAQQGQQHGYGIHVCVCVCMAFGIYLYIYTDIYAWYSPWLPSENGIPWRNAPSMGQRRNQHAIFKIIKIILSRKEGSVRMCVCVRAGGRPPSPPPRARRPRHGQSCPGVTSRGWGPLCP